MNEPNFPEPDLPVEVFAIIDYFNARFYRSRDQLAKAVVDGYVTERTRVVRYTADGAPDTAPAEPFDLTAALLDALRRSGVRQYSRDAKARKQARALVKSDLVLLLGPEPLPVPA